MLDPCGPEDPCLDLLKVDEELLILKQTLTQKTEKPKKDLKKKPVCKDRTRFFKKVI